MNGHTYTNEQNNWLKNNYYNQPLNETVAIFNATFNTNLSQCALKSKIKTLIRIRNCPSRKYTSAQDTWLIKNFPQYPNKYVTELYNQTFGTNISERSLVQHCNVYLKLKKSDFLYTTEQIAWLRENYPKYETAEQTYQKFIKLFGTKHTLNSIIQQCYKNRIPKRTWTDQEIEFLKNNYATAETIPELYEKFEQQFPGRKTFIAFTSYAKNLGVTLYGRGQFTPDNNPRTNLRKQYGIISDDIVLSDLGNGQYLPMDRKIHKKLSRQKGNLKSGEITETLYEIELVRSYLKKL